MAKRYRIIDVEDKKSSLNAGIVTVQDNKLTFSKNTFRAIRDVAAYPELPLIRLNKEKSEWPDEKETGKQEHISATKQEMVKQGEELYFESFREWLMGMDFVLEEIKE